MADVLVVADDLTGANAVAAGFARAGLRAVTVRAAERADVVAEMVSRFDVVVATTESRHSAPDIAQQRVAAAVRAGWPARLVCNRIDTTLRGNVGATTKAVLDEVRTLAGGRVVVLCAPAYPAAGRHTIGGTQLLGGRRLEDTEVARDSRNPMGTSDVAEILGQQADVAATVIPLSTVTGSDVVLVGAIRQALDADVEVLVVDATTEEHLDRIASAAVEASKDLPLVWVTSDPGPASVAMARALSLERKSAGAPLLVVSGSATQLTRTQLAQLGALRQTRLHRTPSVDGGGAVPDVDRTAALLDEALSAAGADDIVVIATAVAESDICELTLKQAEEIPVALAKAVRRNLEMHSVDGVFSTGGDVTAALLAELGSHGLEISDEVVPLAVAGTLVGGGWDGLQVVTKGGLVGDAHTAVACVDHLRRNADLHRRQVASAESRTPY